MSHRLLGVVLIAIAAAVGLSLSDPVAAQKPAETKFKHAVVRSQDSAKIIELLNEMTDQGFPRELAARAQAIEVFPLVKKQTVLFQQTMDGYGVVSSRTTDGWTLPAFYKFAGVGYTGKFAGDSRLAVILLFMNNETVTAFAKGGVSLEDQKKALAGPAGAMTDQQKTEVADANILGYVYAEGKLIGANFGTSFKKFVLDPDNNVNTPMYGMKGRLVLAGNKVDTATLPDGIDAFQQTLRKYYP